MHRRRIEALRDEKFKCKYPIRICVCMQSTEIDFIHDRAGTDEYRSRYAGECQTHTECPAACSCDQTVVDCSGRGLKEIPRDIPLYTTEL